MKICKTDFILLILIAAISLPGCKNSKTENENDAKNVAEEHNDAKFTTHKSEKDAQFLVDAADINLTEMNLGQLAESKAVMSETKELGAMMHNDHKKAYDDLASLAAKKTISIPSAMTESAQKDYNKL